MKFELTHREWQWFFTLIVSFGFVITIIGLLANVLISELGGFLIICLGLRYEYELWTHDAVYYLLKDIERTTPRKSDKKEMRKFRQRMYQDEVK